MQDLFVKKAMILETNNLTGIGFSGLNDPNDEKAVVHFGWLVAVAHEFERNLIIICSDLSLRFIRNIGDNFVFYKTIDGPTFSSNTWLVGITAASTYHYVDPPSNSDFWDMFVDDNAILDDDIYTLATEIETLSTNRLGKLSDESGLQDEYVPDSPAETAGPESQSSDLSTVVESDPGTNAEEMNVEGPTTSSNDVDDVVEKLSRISIFERFTCRDKIDFEHESANLMVNATFSQTFDCDAMIAYADLEQLINIIKSPLTLKKSQIAGSRDLNTFKNSFPNVFNGSQLMQMVQIGHFNFMSINVELFAVYGLSSEDVNEIGICSFKRINHVEFIREIVKKSVTFPCTEDSYHSLICTSSELRAQRNSSIPFSGLREDTICKELVSCFLFHFETIFFRRINLANVKMKFYIRIVGSKTVLTAPILEELGPKIEVLSGFVDFLALPESQCFVDFCIQSVPLSTQGILVRYYIFFNFFKIFSCLLFGKLTN